MNVKYSGSKGNISKIFLCLKLGMSPTIDQSITSTATRHIIVYRPYILRLTVTTDYQLWRLELIVLSSQAKDDELVN